MRLTADDIVSTDAERACLAALREATGRDDGPMERHSLRVFLLAERLGADGGASFERELALCASLLHDVGAYPLASEGGVYVSDGRRFTERTLGPFAWSSERLRVCLDAVEHHHELRPQWARGAEVELIRRADLVDVVPGLITFGLPRPWLRGLMRAVPRTGIYSKLARIAGRLVRERPATIPPIFFPRTEDVSPGEDHSARSISAGTAGFVAIREVADEPASGELSGYRPLDPPLVPRSTMVPADPWAGAVSRRPPPLVRPARIHARGESSDPGRTTR